MKDNAVDIKELLDRNLIDFYIKEINSFYLIINENNEVIYFSENSLNFFNIKSIVELDSYELKRFIGYDNSDFIGNLITMENIEDNNYKLPSAINGINFDIKIKPYSTDNKKHFFTVFIKKQAEKKNIEDANLYLYKIALENIDMAAGIINDNEFIFKNTKLSDFLLKNSINKYDSLIQWIESNIYDNSFTGNDILNDFAITISKNEQKINLTKKLLIDNNSLLTIEQFKPEEKIIYKTDESFINNKTDSQTDVLNYQKKLNSFKEELTTIKNKIENYNNEITEKFSVLSTEVINKIQSNIKEYESIIKYTSKSLITMSENSTFIDEISIRIHLISINAAIESARSGEHGKGFAVISKEIAKLSDSIKGYAKSISSEIDSIKKITKSTIDIEKKEEILNAEELYNEINNLQVFVKKIITEFKSIIVNKLDEVINNL
jgi:methyl-accepting chemotaxis protein